ncbi:NAD-dependent protein deacylase [Lactococcus termiticola]|uniref:protein acetyllysine N-acetyltransferase n=1 Tax=Lactococcus termiticola TaxID=2169526 RepID=A0A2R5HGX0_9LACT|nr:NAD-dependent protein deacylase [Lactococcus termiticola]GBG97106.1 NAD-dependent deacetylase [Lactococcus termiticola]
MQAKAMAEAIQASQRPVFMTGAGVSTLSGIPDYRSMTGIYTTTGLKNPEYLLSRRAMIQDSKDWYSFVKQLYHPEAKPNLIHEAIARLGAPVITQNIDGLHAQAGSQELVEFHGSIRQHYCEQCGQDVKTEDFLDDYRHKACGGLVRPDVVFYDEAIKAETIEKAVELFETADSIFIVGTTFKVYPFASLIDVAPPEAKIYAINRESIALGNLEGTYLGDAKDVFELI